MLEVVHMGMSGRADRVPTDGACQLAAGEHIVVDQDPVAGLRLKYYSRKADVQYWTDLWRQAGDFSYAREAKGHLPHQLRDTFRRWAKPGGRTLEAGCGPGQFTVAANALGYRAEGLDWSAETIEGLRQRLPSIRWHLGDVRNLEFPSGTFDAVYLPGVCEHFEDGPANVLAETRRVLRDGGVAVVSTPCFNSWLQRHADRITATPAALAGVSIAPCDFYQYAFTPEGMAKLLGQLGFEVLQVRPYAVLDTFIRYAGWRVPGGLARILAYPVDYLPGIREWGSTCIWVGRKC